MLVNYLSNTDGAAGEQTRLRAIFRYARIAIPLALVSFWVLSYSAYVYVPVESHLLRRRFEAISTSGSIFAGWATIKVAANGDWEPVAQVELDELFVGFGFYSMPGAFWSAGEIAVPYWALVTGAMCPFAFRRIRKKLGVTRTK
jgi:hypothetical protein